MAKSMAGETDDEKILKALDISDLKGIKKYDYENLVLEGGGAKTAAFAAALEVMSELGMLQSIKRIAGASGGAVAGALLAVGYTPSEIREKFMSTMGYIKDARFGFLSALPNLFRYFGWHPGNKALSELEEAIAEKCGNGQLTFKELYDKSGTELCIVTTNISAMTSEFFHPKTTPDTSIAEAVRMSISIPCFMAPYKKSSPDGAQNVFVDGGVLCNYPIHVFDGWFLSMDKKDTFFKKLGGDELPFGKFNDKTLGMVVYAADEVDVMKLAVHKRIQDDVKIPRPNTTLSRDRGPKIDKVKDKIERKSRVLDAARTLMIQFRKYDKDDSSTISREELKELFESSDGHTQEALETLFGTKARQLTYNDVITEVDQDKNGEINFVEFMSYLEKKEQVNFNEFAKGVATLEIKSLGEFFGALLNTFQVESARTKLGKEAASRTIGVFTDYIKALDTDMEQEDMDYLSMQGKLATINFLRDKMSESKQ